MQNSKMEITSNCVDQTIRLGEAIGSSARSGEVIALIGELGTGKTHLIKGIARGLAADSFDEPSGDNLPREMVTSPTFTLLNEYERPGGEGRFYHLDCYRLQNASEAPNEFFFGIHAGDSIYLLCYKYVTTLKIFSEIPWLSATLKVKDLCFPFTVTPLAPFAI